MAYVIDRRDPEKAEASERACSNYEICFDLLAGFVHISPPVAVLRGWSHGMPSS